MKETQVLSYIEKVVETMPTDWLTLTTHRLDIYEEELAKTQFLERFEALFEENNSSVSALADLPTAFDYIRLGHPLSSILEWAIAQMNGLKSDNVISFSSRAMPVLAVLRKNLMEGKKTLIAYKGKLPGFFDAEALEKVYGFSFELKQVENTSDVPKFEGSTIVLSQQDDLHTFNLNSDIDFFVSVHEDLGSVIVVNGASNESYIGEIQHIRRRESIAMTPANCHAALNFLLQKPTPEVTSGDFKSNREKVIAAIQKITDTHTEALLGSCGLTTQYAIMMGLVEDALENHPGKDIKFIVPPNCYGGTNDQARRVAACVDNVEVVDLPVDGEHDMADSANKVLARVAEADAVPYIIAEIPTNPRVEVPDLQHLKEVLGEKRKTSTGQEAIPPVFILDQTFCPNVHFLGEGEILSEVKAISYVSGSKFPSGGRCTAGYCVANEKAKDLFPKVEKHFKLCDNEATELQVEILAEQLPSMNQRIKDAYKNTREFVNFIEKVLPEAKINFVPEELAEQGFTPSVFSLDLPTEGKTDEERESFKRALNLKLIHMMIEQIPNESKYCVSYGQLKGCYWTVPATSTQGTTKEGDKDYIVRVTPSPDMDLERHKQVFQEFVNQL